jgi:phosphonopyruvate decarboxylase
LPPRTIVVSTTGKCSRELYELRAKRNESNERDFLTIGGMGHANQIALGIALERPERQVLCLDGDGAALMHLGSLAIVAQSGARNLRHIVINNGAHDSVGGQPTLGFDVKLLDIARACGYRHYATLRSTNDRQYETGIAAYLAASADNDGPSFLEICVNKGARDDLGTNLRRLLPASDLQHLCLEKRSTEENAERESRRLSSVCASR